MKTPPEQKKRRDLTPTGATPARLPAPPSIGGITPPSSRIPAPPRLPAPPTRGAKGAGPGRRNEVASDISVTHRLERITVERTPAPLPPSPAAADAEKWFEQVPTNPAAPQLLDRHSQRASSGSIEAHAPVTASGPTQVGDGRPPWLLPVLIAATSLTIGMILGALLFGGDRHGARGAACPPADCGSGSAPAPAPTPTP